MEVDAIAKGGRGKKAPYKTTHYRIPEPTKQAVEKLTAAYRKDLEAGGTGEELLVRVEAAIEKTGNSFIEKPVNNYEEIRDRILSKTRSDKLKAVEKALDEFIQELNSVG